MTKHNPYKEKMVAWNERRQHAYREADAAQKAQKAEIPEGPLPKPVFRSFSFVNIHTGTRTARKKELARLDSEMTEAGEKPQDRIDLPAEEDAGQRSQLQLIGDFFKSSFGLN